MLRSTLRINKSTASAGTLLSALLCAVSLASCGNDVIDFVDRGLGYDLTIATDGGLGDVSLAANRKVLSWGTVVTLTPMPGTGYFFGGWSGEHGSEIYSDGSEWKLLMDGDKTVVAGFSSYPTLMLSTDGGRGIGSVSLSPPGPTYELGTVVTLTPSVTVGDSSFFALWSGLYAAEVTDNGDGTYAITMNGSKSLSAVFTQVLLAGGESHSVITEIGGSIWTFGFNNHGQLGDGSTTTNGTPTKLAPFADIVDVDSHDFHNLALTADGTVYAWGINNQDQLAVGMSADVSIPARVRGVGGSGYLSGIVAIAPNAASSHALGSDGSVYAWGWNAYGQLGNGSTTTASTPVRVKGVGGSGYLTDIVAINAGYYHTLALGPDGSIYTWGRNYQGQLGVGSTTDASTPVRVKGVGGAGNLSGIVLAAAGGAHSVAMAADGSVYAWGYNNRGQLGDPAAATYQMTPVRVLGEGGAGYLGNVIAIAMGESYTMALTADGRVYAWGENTHGELGDGTTTNRTTPVRVAGPGGSGYLTDVVGIGAGRFHALALTSDGRLYAWGRNDYGELGDGSTTNRTTPVEVNIDF